MPDVVVVDPGPWRRMVARIQAQAEADPELFRLQADATDSIIARWDELSPAQRRRYGRLKPLQLTRRQATELLRHKTQIHVPPRLEDRAPRPRRRSSRRRARAPARPEDPEPDLEAISHGRVVRLIVAWEAEI